jgi:hypothetical protein
MMASGAGRVAGKTGDGTDGTFPYFSTTETGERGRVARILAARNQVLGAPLLAFFARGGCQQHHIIPRMARTHRAPVSGPNPKKQRLLHSLHIYFRTYNKAITNVPRGTQVHLDLDVPRGWPTLPVSGCPTVTETLVFHARKGGPTSSSF